MPTRDHNVLVGMGELLLSLARKHCNTLQWATWLKILLEGAAMEGDAGMALALLKAGASASSGPSNHCSPLHAAARGGSLAVVASLLKTSATRDINKKIRGQTPLHVAVERGHADVALALMRAGGDVNLVDACGMSPLIRAASDGRAELVNDLLLSGSRVNSADKDGDTVLGIAVRLGHLSVIKVLLQAKACPDARGKDNRSPVDLAVERGDTDILRELLASSPSLSVLNDSGDTAMYIAVRHGHVEAIDVLVDAGMDVNYPIEDGEYTPLFLACFCLQPGSVRALLRQNADEKTRSMPGELPHNIVGHGVADEDWDSDTVVDIREMLARAPADRVWRRRGWLAMMNARRHGADKQLTLEQQHRRKDHEDEAEDNQHDEAETPSVPSSRRKLADGGKWATDYAAHVHPSLKRFHSTVTKLVDVADELIFRTVVSYL